MREVTQTEIARLQKAEWFQAYVKARINAEAGA
jgi:hypothetical protein